MHPAAIPAQSCKDVSSTSVCNYAEEAARQLLISNADGTPGVAPQCILRLQITALRGGLQLIGRLNAVEFCWIDDPSGMQCAGFLAQELKDVFPQASNEAVEMSGWLLTALCQSALVTFACPCCAGCQGGRRRNSLHSNHKAAATCYSSHSGVTQELRDTSRGAGGVGGTGEHGGSISRQTTHVLLWRTHHSCRATRISG